MTNKVALSLEIPIPILHDIYPLTDFGFSLAHLVIGNEKYRDFYKKVPHMMDNSMYELGQPLAYDDLLVAIREARPHSVIAPDWMNAADQTSKAATMMKNFLTELPLGERPKVAVVVQGEHMEERMSFFQWAVQNDFRPICFPFRLREERNRLIGAIASAGLFHHMRRYHLLGVNAPHELGVIKGLPGQWSIDTGKPCKPGFDLAVDKWTGRGKLDLMRPYSKTELTQVKQNVANLRALL